MSGKMAGLAWGLALLLVVPSAAGAQSLGEAAAREKAKREKKGKATPAPSYTDEDLKDPSKPADQQKDKDPSKPAPPPQVSGAGRVEGAPRASEGGSGAGGSEAGSPSVGAGDEPIWRSRARDQREAIHNAERSIQEAQDRLNALMVDRDVTNTGDPNRLQTLEARKAEARTSLDAARLHLAEAQKGLQDLEEEARRNSVPPGWLRER